MVFLARCAKGALIFSPVCTFPCPCCSGPRRRRCGGRSTDFCLSRELESSLTLASARGGSLLLGPGERKRSLRARELGRDIRGGAPGQGCALSRACGRAAANAIKNPNWLLKLRITGGPVIASWRRVRRLFWTHPIIFLGRPKLLFSRALAAYFTAAEIDYVQLRCAEASLSTAATVSSQKRGRRQLYDAGRA